MCGEILFRCGALLSPNFCSCFDPWGGKVYFWGLRYIVEKQLFCRLSLWKELNKKGIILLICGICFRLNFDWDVVILLPDSHQKRSVHDMKWDFKRVYRTFFLDSVKERDLVDIKSKGLPWFIYILKKKVFFENTHFEEKFSGNAPILKNSFSLDAPILSVHGRSKNSPSKSLNNNNNNKTKNNAFLSQICWLSRR